MKMLKRIVVLLTMLCMCSTLTYAGMHTDENTDAIETIDVQVVYYLPKDSKPLPDWQNRIRYHIERAQKFHQREFQGQSKLNIQWMEQPFVSEKTQAEMPKDDANNFFWFIINEVSESNTIQFAEGSFPILLVMSDHNFSPGYDDWSRVCSGDSCVFDAPHEQCKGHVRQDGDHRPGSRCGGARAVYWAEKHQGFGLVTADGWRVPIHGTDCVFYHEGIGHSIGLPHPEPNDDSVMGTAQYAGAIHQTWVNEEQKQKLGWEKVEINKEDLFSTFFVTHKPLTPLPKTAFKITAKLPKRFSVKSIACEYQTDIWSAFQSIPSSTKQIGDEWQMFEWEYPGLDAGKSIGYRVTVILDDGKKETVWHYAKAGNER